MGYCITADGQLRIRVEQEAKALEAAKKLFGQSMQRNGSGFWEGTRHWAWIDDNEALSAETLHDMLVAWRYVPQHWEVNEKGVKTYDITFEGEKLGDEYMLFAAIAPFILDGDIEAQGEDGATWRWHFEHYKCVEQPGKVVYE